MPSLDRGVLAVLPEPPSPFGGAAARWYHVLSKELMRREIKLTALVATSSTDDPHATRERYPEVDFHFLPILKNGGLSNLGRLFTPLGCHFSPQMRSALYELDPNSFDLTVFETQASGVLMGNMVPNACINVHQLYSVDLLGVNEGSLRMRFRRRRMIANEKAVLRRFMRITTLTDRLSSAVKRINPHATVDTIPMTVDFSNYRQHEPVLADRRPTVGLIGSFNWPPTISAANTLLRRAWPEIKKKFPSCRCILAGRCASDLDLDGIEYPDDVSIVTDPVEILPYFDELDALLYLPTIGSGIKVKVLEAIAMGVPVVTNEEGGEGLPEAVRRTIEKTSLQDALNSCFELLEDRAHRRETARQLADGLKNTFSMEACVDQWLESHASFG